MQKDENNKEHVIHYISYTFNEVQRHWPSIEREVYAIV